MLFFLFFALSMAQGPPCLLADSGELDPFLYIQSSIQLHNGDLLKLKPVWRIAPAANTLCSNYPGVDCDNTCHVSSFIMNFMWDNGTDVPSWDMGPAQRGPTSVNFWKLTFAFQLLLDIGRNSTGEVPGKQDIPVFADLPVTLVMFAIFSRSNEQVPSQVTIPDDSLKNILVPSATYQGLFIVHLSGIQQGGGTLFSPLCIGVPGVRLILLNSTTDRKSVV